MQELLSDLARLEGGRFDETLFELVRRGPKALDRLFAYIDSDAPPSISAKVNESIGRQWTRVQEVLIELPPKAFSSLGVKALIERGPSDEIARRAAKCIERGMIETAACIATVLSSSENACIERAILEARLLMAAGRPKRAMARLSPYCGPGEAGTMISEWMVAAAMAAGEPRRAFLAMPVREPDVTQASHAVGDMIDACSVEDLAECIFDVARRGDLAGWELIGAAAEEAWERAVQDDADVALGLAGARSEIEGFLDGIESVLWDLESCPDDASRGLIQKELSSLVARANEVVQTIGEAYHLAERPAGGCGATGAPGECGGSTSWILTDGDCWDQILASAKESVGPHIMESLGKSASRQRPPEEINRAVMLAHAEGRPISTRWAEGEFFIEVGLPMTEKSPEACEGSLSRLSSTCAYGGSQTESSLDAGSIARMLRSSQPRQSAWELIWVIRDRERAHATALLGLVAQILEDISHGLNNLSGHSPAAEEAQLEKIRQRLERWDDEVEGCVAKALRNVEDKPEQSEDGGLFGPDRPQDLCFSPESAQALAAADYLLRSARPSVPAPEQAQLISFLIRKAVQTEAECRFDEALADYRLRPAVLRATEVRGKRRRKISPAFAERAVKLAPECIPPDRVLGGLDRLASKVIDGSPKPIAGDMFLMALAFMCFDPLGDPDRCYALGSVLARLDAACQDAERRPDVCDWPGLGRLVCDAISLMSAAGDEL